MGRRRFTDEEKFRTLELVRGGMSVSEVSRFIDVWPSAIYRWLDNDRKQSERTTLNQQLNAPLVELTKVVEELHAIVSQLVEQVRALRNRSDD